MVILYQLFHPPDPPELHPPESPPMLPPEDHPFPPPYPPEDQPFPLPYPAVLHPFPAPAPDHPWLPPELHPDELGQPALPPLLHRVVLDGPEVAADGAREEVLAGRAHLDGARVAAKDGLELELERDGAPPDTVAERVGLLEDMEVEMDGLLVEASEDFLADGAPVDPADGRAGKG
uniref:Putative amelogenin n=1 Tax=Aedes albopictus TaxID=7160 RepID=A0A023EHR8_AEDAL